MKQKPIAAHRSNFIAKFAKYVKEAGEKKTDATRADMLKAFSEFLTGEGIGMGTTRHFELLAKMTAFAGPVRGGGPPGG